MRVNIWLVAAAVAWATPATADILELHGVVTTVGQDSDVPLGQPVTIRVWMDRTVPTEPYVGEPRLRHYLFDEPSADFRVEVSFDDNHFLEPVALRGTSYLINQAQNPSASVVFEGVKDSVTHRVSLHLQTNFENDALLSPELELADYSQADFHIARRDAVGELVTQARGSIQWSRTVRDEKVLLEEANTRLAGALNLLAGLASAVASRASQASLDALGQTLLDNQGAMLSNQANILANQATILANQVTILANQATASAKLDQILRKLR